MKIRWIKQIIDKDYKSPWKMYLQSKFISEIEDVPLYNMNLNDFPTFKDQFYKELFATWAEIHFTEPIPAEQRYADKLYGKIALLK
jgi:hypothetical protein